MRRFLPWLVCASALMFAGCPSTETTTTSAPPPAAPKEEVYLSGHRLYLTQQTDSAIVMLQRAAGMDSTYAAPLEDLGALYYDRAMKEKDGSEARTRALRQSRSYFARVDRLGRAESAVYERLCEIAVALNDDRGFLTYARKNAERYPFDRQYYNLGIACFNAADYAGTVKSQKEAVERFPQSPYVGGFYRQMGRAYQKMDRDQTATKTFTAGVKAADDRLEALKRAGGEYKQSEGYRRLIDDKIGMLTALRNLYQTYRDPEKLRQVEQELKEAGSLR